MVRADERTRTADLLITSVRSMVAERCTHLQIPHRQRVFCSLDCLVLQGIASGLGTNPYPAVPVSGYPRVSQRTLYARSCKRTSENSAMANFAEDPFYEVR